MTLSTYLSSKPIAGSVRMTHMPCEATNRTLSLAGEVVDVLDEDPLLSRFVDESLSQYGVEVRMFTNAIEFVRSPRAHDASCLVLGNRCRTISSLEVQHHLTRSRTILPTICVVCPGDVRSAVDAMQAGAMQVLARPLHAEELIDAAISAATRARELRRREQEMAELVERYRSLTPRERQTMLLITAGMMNKQVGFELGISEITVKMHRSQLMRKMGATRLVELVRGVDALESIGKISDLPASRVRSGGGESFRLQHVALPG
jgi:FixJ family two-component response regulator